MTSVLGYNDFQELLIPTQSSVHEYFHITVIPLTAISYHGSVFLLCTCKLNRYSVFCDSSPSWCCYFSSGTMSTKMILSCYDTHRTATRQIQWRFKLYVITCQIVCLLCFSLKWICEKELKHIYVVTNGHHHYCIIRCYALQQWYISG